MGSKLTSHTITSQFLQVRQKRNNVHKKIAASESMSLADFTKDYKIALKRVNSDYLIGIAKHEPKFIILDSKHVSYR